MNLQNELYTTTDLDLAAWLMAKGYTLTGYTPTKGNRLAFTFPNSVDLQVEIPTFECDTFMAMMFAAHRRLRTLVAKSHQAQEQGVRDGQ